MDGPTSQAPAIEDTRLNKGFRLGDWLVRPDNNALERWRWGKRGRVDIEPKPMQLLLALARADGAVVTREQLRIAVWERDYISDEVITVAVRALRKALEDDPQNPAYIQTFPGKGYRLVCAARPLAKSWLRISTLLAVVAVAVTFFAVDWSDKPPDIPLTNIPENAAELVAPIPDLGAEDSRLYVQAGFIVQQGDVRQLDRAALVLDDLVARNPGVPLLLVTSANARLRAFRFSGFDREYLNKAGDLLDRAVAALPDHSGALGAQAMVLYYRDWDIAGADALFSAALATGDIDPLTRRRYARFLSEQKRFTEAWEVLASAPALDPDASGSEDEAMLLYFEGRYEEAIARLNDLIAARDKPGNAYSLMAMNFEAMGRSDEAMEALIRHYEFRAYDAEFVEVLRRSYADGGQRAVNAFFRDFLIGMKARGVRQSPVRIARYALGAGDRDAAIARLREGMEARDPGILSIAVDPAFRDLWGLPIFDSLVAEIQGSAGG